MQPLILLGIVLSYAVFAAKTTSKKHPKETYDFSSINTLDTLHAQAVSLIHDLINSFDKVTAKPEEPVTAKSEFADAYTTQTQLEAAAYYADTVSKYLTPNDVETAAKLAALRKSLTQKAEELNASAKSEKSEGKKTKRRTKGERVKTSAIVDYATFIPYRISAIKEIIAALKKIDFSEYFFGRLCKLTKLLLNFADYLNYKDVQDLRAFKKNFRALRKRETQLKVTSSAIDFQNIDRSTRPIPRPSLRSCKRRFPCQKTPIPSNYPTCLPNSQLLSDNTPMPLLIQKT